MNPNIVLIGAPGSGKGTQSAKLIEKYGYKHISTGDLLRAEIAKSTELGKRVSSVMAMGNLVDDATVMELLAANCDLEKCHYIFDGFPRNIEQSILLDNFLEKGVSRHVSIYLKVDIDTVVKRISQRRICSKCGSVYSLAANANIESIPCAKCGEENTVKQRKDDMPDVVENRLKVFADAIQPMLTHYNLQKTLHTVEASDSEDIVFKKIANLIDDFKLK